MKLIKKSILLLALAGGTFLSGGKAYAQQTLVDVRVDSAAILIGEQTVLHLTVTADKDKAVQLVIPRDTLMAGVEVLEIPKADSTLIENDRLLIEQDLLVTSFDSSLYLLPPVYGDRRGGYRLLQPSGLEGVDGSCQCRQTGGVLRY